MYVIHVKFKNKKLEPWIISNFFHYAHHLSTIEGGMICTNNKEIYKISRMFVLMEWKRKWYKNYENN